MLYKCQGLLHKVLVQGLRLAQGSRVNGWHKGQGSRGQGLVQGLRVKGQGLVQGSRAHEMLLTVPWTMVELSTGCNRLQPLVVVLDRLLQPSTTNPLKGSTGNHGCLNQLKDRLS
jgi:hypothetical protein